ncbi:uncharacterized protein LOC111912854 [Lactuca sativa]|uniref:uncharacterized protein LOC111912854 n=1 Tax=Lactuca sativa TaxID=4236 RepID=UPI000CC46A6A|nr:uncharacterized protein LOC111912854 [Lactuca sativa]XP_023764349.1 uncharacterized protein LOC111912854 [Lactuca sativa]
MARTRSMARNQNDDAAASSSREMPKTCEHWSDLDHDLLDSVMMRLGVVDYYSFRGVCKSWRLLACSNENKFMASMPPMTISICCHAHDKTCFLEDFERRRFKTILPNSAVAACVGLTCGYLIFFVKKTHSFWLVNPITRKELHFPNFPSDYNPGIGRVILVFSPSIYGWAFVLLLHSCREIWFSIEGKGAWNHVSSYPFCIHDIYAFKGKIYALSDQMHRLFELRLIPHPKLTMLEIKKLKYFFYATRFVSSGERLCVRPPISKFLNELHELDFGEMKWVKPCEKTFEEYAFFYSDLNHGADVAVKWESLGRFASFPNTDDDGNITFFTAKMWYFPHQSMDVDRIDE